MIRLCLLVFAWVLSGFLSVHAADAPDLAQDPVVEKRLNLISEELRCLVCQNESLAGSRADLAVDLRREIRTLIKDGKTDAEIRDFMVKRYGDFVLYRPPVKPLTWVLWFGPVLLLLLAAWGLWRLVRHKPQPGTTPAPLTPEQVARARELLDSDTERS